MSTMQNQMPLGELLNTVQFKGEITDQDVLAIRRAVYGDAVITSNEADQIFALNALSNKPDSWIDLFIESITSFVVRQTLPYGYVSTANAMWLMARIDHDGVVEAHSELELLLNIMRTANNITPELEAYALNQVKQAVMHNRGFVGRVRDVSPGQISDYDVELLRRILFSASSEEGIGIAQSEAEMLFELNDALGRAQNHPSWQKLFVGAVANHVMAVAAWDEPDAQEALRRRDWLQKRGDGFAAPSFSGLGAAFKSLLGGGKAAQTYASTANAAIQQAEQISFSEANWLIQRLNKDGVLCENEKLLLKFLRDESPDIHAALTPYINAV